MIQWWNEAHELIMKEHLTLDVIRIAVAGSVVRLRDGCSSIMNICRDKNIPALVFSAGLGDIIVQGNNSYLHSL